MGYLEDLYLGDHDNAGDTNVNLCFPSVQTRLSMMTVDSPFFHIESKSPRSDDPGSNIEARTKLREDTLNCVMSDPSVGFVDATSLGVQEAHYQFAVAEIVYSNDFIDNPNANKPLLDDSKPDETGEPQPAKIPDPDNKDYPHEMIKVKRISPKCFYVGMGAGNCLYEADWSGYYEWHLVSDVKANPNYDNTSGLKATGKLKDEYVDPVADADANESKEGMVKLWKIWDHRAKKRRVFAEGGDRFLLEKDYDLYPFEDLKFHEIGDEYYPLPPMFNWKGPQTGLTKTRKAQDEFLSSAKDKYLVRDGAIEQAELEKLERNVQNTYAKATGSAPLSETVVPIQRPPMDASFWRNLPASKEDFIQVSAVSSEQRGVADSDTATQANIIDVNSKRREIKDATKVAYWMARIGKKVLMTIQKNFELPIVVKTNVDIAGPNAQTEAANVIRTWREIQAEDLGDLNYEVTVNVETLSPISDQEEQRRWQNIVGLLGPAAVPVMAQSRLITEKVTGFKSDRDITEAQKAFQTVVQMQQQMAEKQMQAKQGGAGADQGPGQLLAALMGGQGQ